MLNEREKDLLRACFRERAAAQERCTLLQARRIAMETGLPLLTVECFALEQGLVPERYDRNVGTIGVEGQRKLLESCAGVVGLGGLGGHVLESLARLGVGRIVGIDGDRFEESNLNRQLLALVDNLGRAKAQEAGVRVAQINPAVQFTGHTAPFEQMGDEVLSGCSVVFDCLDSIAARRVLAEQCTSANVTLVHGAIAGWSGQVAVCWPGSELLDRLYPGDKRGIEHRLGNLPFTAAVAGHLMVARAVPILLGQAPPASDKVLLFDLLGEEWQTVEL